MTKHVHGGDVYRHKDCLDFSANLNPLGTPESVKQAIIGSLDHIAQYPQVGCDLLREKIAEYEGVKKEEIVCGNGAAEVIFTLCRAVKPKKALLPAPTFAEYGQALESTDCKLEYYMLTENEGFVLGESYLDILHKGLDMAFLCNPNNPTGMLIPHRLLKRILEKCRKLGILLVVDECFLDFLPDCDALTAKALLDSKNLLILKAFTKLYGMAGVRLGYCLCANTALLEAMQAAGQPWAVSSLAQAAGLAALDETAYVAQVRALIAQQRPRLTAGLRALGLRVLDGRANYLLFQGPETLGDALRQRGVVLRSCSNYPGLDGSWYRTAVRTGPENDELLKTLAEVLA